MSDELKISGSALLMLARVAEKVFGYCYCGFLPLFLVALQDIDFVKKMVEATGGLLAAFICIVIGIGIYAIYFRIVGEFLIFPFQHKIHSLFDRYRGRRGEFQTSPVNLLKAYGVSKKDARFAYHRVRDVFFKGRQQVDIQIAHGELSVPYITSVITVAAYFILHTFDLSPSRSYLYIAAFCFFAAILGDTHQHAKEAAYIKRKRGDIITFLKEEGFVNQE